MNCDGRASQGHEAREAWEWADGTEIREGAWFRRSSCSKFCARAGSLRQGLEDGRHRHGGGLRAFEPDLIMDACKRAGLECNIIAQDWDGMIPGLKAGKFDVIMDGMSITDERKKEIDFSKPYAVSPGAFLAPKDSPLAKATGAGALINLDKDAAAGDAAIKGVQAALKGKTLGVQVSTTHSNFASEHLKGVADVKEYKTADDRDLDLKSGRIDACLDDYTAVAATADKPDAKDLAIVGPKFIGGMFG